MKSRFQLFFIVSKVLLSAVVLVFLILPVFVFIDAGTKHIGEAIIPAIVVMLFAFPLVYLYLKDFDIVNITLNEDSITIKSWRYKIDMYYKYSEISGIKNTLYKVEGYTRGPDSNPDDINYEPVSTIYFKDGTEFTMYDDTYCNIQEMLDFIKSKRTL